MARAQAPCHMTTYLLASPAHIKSTPSLPLCLLLLGITLPCVISFIMFFVLELLGWRCLVMTGILCWGSGGHRFDFSGAIMGLWGLLRKLRTQRRLPVQLLSVYSGVCEGSLWISQGFSRRGTSRERVIAFAVPYQRIGR